MGCKAGVQLTTNMQSVFVYSLFVVMLIWKVNVRPEKHRRKPMFLIRLDLGGLRLLHAASHDEPI